MRNKTRIYNGIFTLTFSFFFQSPLQSFLPNSSTQQPLSSAEGLQGCGLWLVHSSSSLLLLFPSHIFPLFLGGSSPLSFRKNSVPAWGLHELKFLQEISICSSREFTVGCTVYICPRAVLYMGCRGNFCPLCLDYYILLIFL